MESDGVGLRAGKPELFLETQFNERGPVFSPDGRWLAYALMPRVPIAVEVILAVIQLRTPTRRDSDGAIADEVCRLKRRYDPATVKIVAAILPDSTSMRAPNLVPLLS